MSKAESFPQFDTKQKSLTDKDVFEISEFFRFLNVCGECGKWHSIFYAHLGICMEDYLDSTKDSVKKTCAWCLGCEEFQYWKEVAWFVPSKDQFEIVLETKKLLFTKGLQWAEDLIKPQYEKLDPLNWHIILAQLMNDKEVKKTYEKEIDEIYTQTDEEDEELSDQEEGFIDDNLLEEEE